MNWYLKVLKEYVNFSGRARRTEYWMFFLFNVVITIVLAIVAHFVPPTEILSTLYSLAVLLPGIGVAVRRLHDTNRSGWLLLIGLIPLGVFYVLYLLVQDSQPETNEYGPNPKAA